MPTAPVLFSLLLAGVSMAQAPAAPCRSLLVLDEHGYPVSDATVAFRSPGDRDITRELSHDCELAFENLPRFGTDAAGRVTLPTDLALAAVMARAGDRFGAAAIAFDDPMVAQQVLRIAPERRLEVIVRDDSDEPRAGVPIEVLPPQSQWDEFCAGPEQYVGETNAEGRLTIFHAQSLCTWNLAHPLLRLRARVVGVESPFVSLDLRQPVTAPVALTCPPFGTLVVRRWLVEGVRDAVLPDMHALLVPADENAPFRRASGTATPGEWRSRPLALGATWRLYGARRVVDAEGPRRDREQACIDILESDPPPRYPNRVSAGVVLELPDGTPCSDAAVILGEPDDAHRDRAARARTDARGSVQFAVPRPSRDFDLHFFVPERNLVACRRVSEAEASAATDLVDLGRLRLREPRLAAAGRTIDAVTRLPVRARISLRDGAAAFEVPTGPDGTFVVFDDPLAMARPKDSCRIEALPMHWVRRTATRALVTGARDLELALERPPVLRCRILADLHVAAGLLRLRALHADGAKVEPSQARSRSGQLEYGCRLPDAASDPDDWQLVVEGARGLELVRTERGAGFDRDGDGLAVTLDLTGQLAEFDLHLPYRFFPGEAGSFAVREVGADGPWLEQPLWTHCSFLGKAGATLEVIVSPREYPASRLVLAPGETTVTLPPRPVFEIEIVAPSLPDGELAAHVVLLARKEPLIDELEKSGIDDSHDDPRGTWPLPGPRLDELIRYRPGTSLRPGKLRVEVPRLGSYFVLPFLRRDDGNVLLVDDAIVLETGIPGEVVTGELRLDPDRLQAARGGR